MALRRLACGRPHTQQPWHRRTVAVDDVQHPIKRRRQHVLPPCIVPQLDDAQRGHDLATSHHRIPGQGRSVCRPQDLYASAARANGELECAIAIDVAHRGGLRDHARKVSFPHLLAKAVKRSNVAAHVCDDDFQPAVVVEVDDHRLCLDLAQLHWPAWERAALGVEDVEKALRGLLGLAAVDDVLGQ